MTIPKPTDVLAAAIWANSASSPAKARPIQGKMDSGFADLEKPPYSEHNYLWANLTQWMAYCNQEGMPEWDALTPYIVNSMCKRSGSVYVCLVANTGSDPSSSPTEWQSLVTDFQEIELGVNDATPSVSGRSSFKTANTATTTITDFDDGSAGQKIAVRIDDVFTVIDGGLTKTGMTIPLIVGDLLEFYYDGTTWRQSGGTVGMGQFVKILSGVTDWMPSTGTNTVMDLTKDEVRKGAISALISINCINSTGDDASHHLRPNGSTSVYVDLGAEVTVSPNYRLYGQLIVDMDEDAKIEGYITDPVSSTTGV